jgi:hypothetical protein
MSFSVDWLKAIQLKPRFLFAFGVLGSFIIFLPQSAARSFGFTDIPKSLRPLIGIATLGSFTFWVVQLIPEYRIFQSRKREKHRLVEALDSISGGEWVVLAYCLDINQQTIPLSLADRAGGMLASKGMLLRSGGTGNQLAWPHTIPDFLWTYLKKHRREFLTKSPYPQEQIAGRLQGLDDHIHRHEY